MCYQGLEYPSNTRPKKFTSLGKPPFKNNNDNDSMAFLIQSFSPLSIKAIPSPGVPQNRMAPAYGRT
jgi:hypothetical protein